MHVRHVFLILTLLSLGCSDRGLPPGAPPVPDASVPDGSVPDASPMDAAQPDATSPDASDMDASAPDASVPDASVPDASVPDASAPDASVPDASAPDAMMDSGSGTCVATDLGMRMGVDLAMGSTAALTHVYTPSCTFSSVPSPEAIYSWVAPRAGTFTIDTNGSTFDTILFVTMGDCAGAEVACDDDGGEGTRSRARVTLAAGAAITIFVDGFSGASGDYSLSITESPETEAGACRDMMDNDRDGYTDCADSDCAAEPGCTETDCSDGVDDDGDGRIDCDDFDCYGEPACIETDCSDGLDDDGDGDIDCRDSDCIGEPGCSETDCADGIDDEGDGRIDCDDFDCSGDMACGERMCDDGRDDDSDSYTDCADSECRCDPVCIVGGDGCATEATDLAGRTGAGVAMGTVAPGLCSRRMGSCAGRGHEVYFNFTAPSAGAYTITTEGSTYDTVLYAHDMSCTGAELACNDDSVGLGVRSSITITLRASQSVVIVLDAYSSSGSGDYVLNITPPGGAPPPPPPPPPMP